MTQLVRDLPTYPPGGGGGGGGGKPGGGSGGTVSTFVPFSENGGFAATAFVMFVPVQASTGGGGYISTFSPVSYDDANDASSYSYRQEDIIPNRVPTVRRIAITYRNIGLATRTITVTAINDAGATVTATQTQQIGDTTADSTLRTIFYDLVVTGFRPQLTISRAAGGGPISIIRASMIGEVENASL
jgi:hypothetical protein